jgi:hypothetical protein
MALCVCGCGQKVKFGRGYLNTRSLELRVVSNFAMLVHAALARRPIPNTPPTELVAVRSNIDLLAARNSYYSVALHDYSVGSKTEIAVSDVLNNRQNVFNDELLLIDAACYSSSFCLLNGSLSKSDFLREVDKFSSTQRVKVKMSFNTVRMTGNEAERALLPQL